MNKNYLKVNDKKKITAKRRNDMIDLTNKIFKSANGQLKLRCKRVMESWIKKNSEIEQLKNNHEKFKEGVIKYHKQYIEKSKDEDLAFLNAMEMSQLNGPPFSEILKKNMENVHKEKNVIITPRKTEYNEKTINRKDLAPNRNVSVITISPITPHRNLSTMIRTHDNSKFLSDNSVLSYDSRSTSPLNDSITSCSNTINNQSVYQHHDFIEATTKKSCSYCTAKDLKDTMRKCKTCSIYIHDSCIKSDKHFICIPMTTTKLVITNNRSLRLTDIGSATCQPMVPGVLLCLMHHIQMFGLKTCNLYTNSDDTKEVKKLCNKLLAGKHKCLIKSGIRTVANAFLMILQNLKEPLLPQSVANELMKCNQGDSCRFLNSIVACLKGLQSYNLDTLIYVLIHFKVISMNYLCSFDAKRLADKFSAILVGSQCNKATCEVLEMLINIDIKFYIHNFLHERIFFMPYFLELSK